MNKYLFGYDFKSNKFLILPFILILMLYSTIAVGMFDPEEAQTMQAMMEMLPDGMVRAFGFNNLGTDLTVYLAGYLYGFIYFIFPGIMLVILANRLVVKHVDSGSMAYVITTPITRVKLAITQIVFLSLSLLAVIGTNVLIVIVMSVFMFPGHLDVGNFLLLNLVTYSTLLFVSSLLFLASTYFNEHRTAIGVGSFIPVVFFVLNMIRNVSEQLSFLKYFTVFSLVDSTRIYDGSSYAVVTTVIVLALSIGVFALATAVFNKKSLVI